ncbi:MAG: OmpH family outer membrane protein [Fusobacterium sp.]|nr:OmpH family outer membrane protein [Fusobacterium sp.]
MKKILIPAMALMLSVSAFAMKVGYVNSQEAFAKFSQTKTVQENLNKEKTRLENEIKQKEVALQKAQLELQAKGTKVTDKEKTAFEGQVKAFQKFIQDSQTKLSKEEFTRFQAIENTMNNAISEVAKAGKYDYVFEAGAVKFGGENITDKVISTMEKNKK